MENYRKIEIKGKGSYGQAILVQSITNRRFYILKAIDVQQFDRKQKEDALNEIHVLKSLHHPFIIRYRESFVDKSRYLCIVMDYADNGTIDSHIQIQKQKKEYFSEDQILNWFTQICLAIKYIHDKKIIHRDIKTQNIFLLRDNTIKLGDFGIARILTSSEDLCLTSIGTPYYISPEMCQHQPYNHKSDIWSLGCILFELITLRHPFDAKNIEGLIIKIIRGQTPQIPKFYSNQIQDLIQSLLIVDPIKRLSIDEVLNIEIVKEQANSILEKMKKEQKPQQQLVKIDDKLISIQSKAEQMEHIRCLVENLIDLKDFQLIYQTIQNNLFQANQMFQNKFDQKIIDMIIQLVELENSAYDT